MATFNVSWQDIEQAHERVKPYIHRTPVLSSESINTIVGAELYFKCENFQKIGAFKARGGINAVFSLPKEQRSRGVVTHSSGNHAQAIALAAKMAGVPAYIVMPKTAPQVKIAAVEGYGAHITLCEPTQASREETSARIQKETGAVFISPYNDFKVIEGQATCAKELLEELPELNTLITPVGGGGLLAGTALTAHYLNDKVEVLAGEPEGANDTYLSVQKGELVRIDAPKSIADGLLATMGDKNFEIIRPLVKQILVVSDSEIIDAMRMIWERMKIVIEPSCAVPFAAILKNKELFEGKKVGVILTGGNIDLGKLPF
ncbi:pyridoxal-phosphate dependent enzyme [Roseivirga sp. UBA838]|uniref:pyridoxal-phosphate dependent enzyme n=1 Tax=Roseivirga sp. UBA838 TaxID=1947393 RepID=UPI00257A9E1A|nr:pyridoxal-phosphate dependent enzyme [Roseivirga sp. UBA838]|tara:strand:+ start:10215 stop:11165 length:951 start_codon:yes stop_codon:yes gene_type:complete